MKVNKGFHPRWSTFTQIVAPVLMLIFAYGYAISATLTFGVIGDFGDNNLQESDVASLMASWPCDLIITVGDNNYPYGEASTIDANVGKYFHSYIYPYKGIYGSGSSLNRFFPALGNHDWKTPGAAPYFSYFTLPGNERYYDFVRGPVHFFCLDSDYNEPDGTSSTSVQGNWLKNRLAASTAPWRIVYFHHAPYSSGNHGNAVRMQWPFKSWGANAVLAGHDHDYERVIVDGLPYFVNGLGGGGMTTMGTPIPGSQVRYSSDWGAMKVTATDTTVTFQFITRNGSLIDNYALSKPSTTLQTPSIIAKTAAYNRIDLLWTDSSSTETGFQLYRSGDGISFTRVATLGANVTSFIDKPLPPSAQYFYKVRAYNATSTSAYSNIASATTPPSAPTGLAATARSNTQISLSWTDTSSYELGVKIFRSTDGVNFTQIVRLAANATTYADTSVTGGHVYYYKVRCYDYNGNSAYSNTASARTPAP